MVLDSCLTQVINEAIRHNNYFPLITYKIGTFVALPLHAYAARYTGDYSNTLIFAFVTEIVSFSLAAFLCLYRYDFLRTHLVAYSVGMDQFPLASIIGKNAWVGSYVINSLRFLTACNGIDIVRSETYSKNLKEKDVVLIAGSCALLVFSFWACVVSIRMPLLIPDYNRCL